ncbi:hypothetical protein QFZ68_007586 [Streptomyces sp. V1I6]|nr:hypothetical protein [Streptomyces sp. V1I6]
MRFLQFCRYLRSLNPPKIRIAIVLDNFSLHLTTMKDTRVDDWAVGKQRGIRLHADQQFLAQPHRGPVTALRYFALDGTDHSSHKEQGSMIRRYIIRRNKHAADKRLREVVNRVNVA